MLKLELALLKLLNKHNVSNIIKFICDFSCEDEKLKWNVEINRDTEFCDGTEPMHFIVLEHVKDVNIGDFFAKHTLNKLQFISFLKQIMMCIIELYQRFKIRHGYIHNGNILIISNSENNVNKYIIGNKIYHIPMFLILIM